MSGLMSVYPYIGGIIFEYMNQVSVNLVNCEIPFSPLLSLCHHLCSDTFSSVQSLSHVQLFATPCIAARQASLSITNSRSLLKLMPIETVMPCSHFILCRPLLLPSIRVFSNELTLHMRWPKYYFKTV